MRECTNAVVVIADVVLLVWRMQAVVREAEAHQDRRNSEVRREVSDNWYRTAGTREDRRLAEDVADRLRRHADCRMIDIHHEPGAGAEHANFALDAARRIFLHPLLDGAHDLLRILPRDQADADFRDSLRGDHRLWARAGETARYSVDFESRPRPRAFEDRVAGFAGQFG